MIFFRMVSMTQGRIIPFALCYCFSAVSLPSLVAPRGLALTLVEREDISRGIASGASLREIARHLDRAVSTVLLLDWPPEQISRWLKTQYPDDRSMRVSHDTIYRSLFIQARGVLKKELLDQLR